MNPKVPVRDVMRRTMHNLRFIEKLATNQGPYEITQLVNSFLGGLAHPWEQFKDELWKKPLSDAHNEGWPQIKKERASDYDPKNLGDLIRLMRNGLAHGNIEFLPDQNDEIRAIRIWNTDPTTKQRRWGCMLTVHELRELLHHFVALAEKLHQ